MGHAKKIKQSLRIAQTRRFFRANDELKNYCQVKRLSVELLV